MRYLPALLLLLLPIATHAADDFSDWPRADILRLNAPTPELVRSLLDEGFVVDTHNVQAIEVYASAAQRAILDQRGIAYVKVGFQPNPPVFGTKAALGEYHSYITMTEALQAYAADYPGITRLVSLGKSIENRELWALEITDNPGNEEDEPEFKYISTIHGNEPVGTEMLLYLIDLLLDSYNTESVQGARLTSLINSTDIWIVPLMNPDGLTAGTRTNRNFVDMNRNFPSYVFDNTGGQNVFDGDPLYPVRPDPYEVEVQRMMEWSAANSFVLSANMHTGELVVNYPFDEGDGPPFNNGVPQPAFCADDALFINVSLRYSVHNVPMYNGDFAQGIVNGRAWYEANGGMQDWNYRYLSNNEVTLELHDDVKKPPQSTLPTLWEQNRESMLDYMESVHIGVQGLVTDACTGAPVYAKLSVSGNAQPVYTDPDVGDYHRMMLPGTYNLSISAPGYATATINSVVVSSGAAARVDVELEPEGGCPSDGTHTADQNDDMSIDLTELLRTIQLYAGYRFQCDANSEDGYAPFGGDCLGCAAYSVDYNPRDCIISLSELLRTVQLFSAGGYTPCPDSPEGDGFCAGAEE